ncbi:Nicotinamide-nucleotide amidohydrolase PncC [Polystyrenella longa]|uniref:Nicotinamide-nucleotide amidohydrolase PncC n=1 Tax=Polystyrenella longa TaxID=2528007 RepID=A0A518CH88_9PLAN|nr:nicotinamide-nucleotide amidohydrolase family protein [Polystyrenella longa]QDU78591.1 Nicotinamide-nucleotide amidohydrolase PncC [Polystyrenella longa]
MITPSDLDRRAATVSHELQKRNLKLICAESCTAGLISATLSRVPGASEWLCGSAVVYRFDTKVNWLGVEREKLDDPGPVSSIVAEQMAAGVLLKTPEACLALSITGDFGPVAPAETDGIAWVGIAERTEQGSGIALFSQRLELQDETTEGEGILRHRRHTEAVYRTLGLLLEHLN